MYVKHKKSGGIYLVQALMVREEDMAFMISYSDIQTGLIWLRPAAEFFDGRFEVHVPHGKKGETEVDLDEAFRRLVAGTPKVGPH